ncbi:putative Exosome component 10 isoform 2 protein [Naja naja]|nr:putative Exosome component 10 isoform 2 protein [Naja naja]
MAAAESGPGLGSSSEAPATESNGAAMLLPGFKDADSFVKHALGTVVSATKASSALPQPGDEYDFYRSFPGFQAYCEMQGERLLQCMSKVMQYHGCRSHLQDRSKVTELEDKFDLLVDANDVILERVGMLLDEAAGVNKNQQPTFRLLHAKNIVRPQLKFREKVDNSNTPFVAKLFVKPNALKPLPKALLKSRQERKERPEDLDMFRPLAETPCHFISTLEELVDLNEKLVGCKEFALDLEHHSYRSFLGLTCLMQISTRTEDFIIDPLELRSDLYILNETFTDPAIVKVLHGADSDVEWLQRDFGLYLVNVFDTHQAARLLNLGRHSLHHLLKLYCDVDAKKQYQLADWRIRPLPEEMVFYAREDTHYLLYIYDRVREALWETANEQPTQLQVVWQRSRGICLKKYTKPIFTDDSYLELYRKQKKHLNTQQLTAFRLLFAWRDKMARQEDESTGEPQGIVACCNPVPPLVRQQLNEMHLIICQAREMPLMCGWHQKERASSESRDPGLPLERANLFSEVEPESKQTGRSPLCLRLRASISVFNYLPAELSLVHISQAAKSDPSSKIYEISNRWKLLSQAQLQAGAKKETSKQKLQAASTPQAAPKDAEPMIKDTETASVRQLAAASKRKKAKPETPQPEAAGAASRFTPFDYSKSDFRVFAGSSKSKPPRQFNPTIQASGNKKFSGASKSQQPAGTKSMSFTAGKSNRGFRHNWPKR